MLHIIILRSFLMDIILSRISEVCPVKPRAVTILAKLRICFDSRLQYMLQFLMQSQKYTYCWWKRAAFLSKSSTVDPSSISTVNGAGMSTSSFSPLYSTRNRTRNVPDMTILLIWQK